MNWIELLLVVHELNWIVITVDWLIELMLMLIDWIELMLMLIELNWINVDVEWLNWIVIIIINDNINVD